MSLDQSITTMHRGLNSLVSVLPRLERVVSQIDDLQTQSSRIQGTIDALVPKIHGSVERTLSTVIEDATRNIMVAG